MIRCGLAEMRRDILNPYGPMGCSDRVADSKALGTNLVDAEALPVTSGVP